MTVRNLLLLCLQFRLAEGNPAKDIADTMASVLTRAEQTLGGRLQILLGARVTAVRGPGLLENSVLYSLLGRVRRLTASQGFVPFGLSMNTAKIWAGIQCSTPACCKQYRRNRSPSHHSEKIHLLHFRSLYMIRSQHDRTEFERQVSMLIQHS